MKKIFVLLFAVFVAFSLNAQSKKWKEMEDFHSVMSQTFHPAEEGQLGPIKSRSQEMEEKALAWYRSDAPEGFDKGKVKAPLKKLSKGAKELNKLVKANASDAVLKEKLSALHDAFHEIMEKCEK
jgi:hypothetical protein